jgi:hypothetical protein
MPSTPRRKQVWIVLSAVYLLLLVGAALFCVLDPEPNTDDKVVCVIGVAVIPAVAFVAAVAPLWRASANRAVLNAAAVFASIAAAFQLMLTFGVAFPLSLVLLALAAIDTHRAARLKRLVRE